MSNFLEKSKYVLKTRFFKTTRQVIRDVQNYFYYLKIIKACRNDEEWNQFKLRLDWFRRIYTVINPDRQDLLEHKEIVRVKILDKAKHILYYISKIGIGELVIPDLKEIPGTYSYSLDFKFLSLALTFKYITLRIGLIIGGIFIYYFWIV